MHLRSYILTLLFCDSVFQGILGGSLPQVLTLAQRMKIFGTESTLTVPDFEYAAIRQINGSDYKMFRKRPANVLQYEVTLDNETFTLTLRPNKNLISKDCLVYNYVNNSDQPSIYPCDNSDLNCFYTGSSDAHNESWVAANVCGGLSGVISIGNTSLLVHPLESSADDNSTIGDLSIEDFHVVYKYQSDKKVCRYDETPGERVHVVQPNVPERTKRDTGSTKHVETSLVVDPSMARFHGEEIEKYVYTVTNIAYKLFRDPSIEDDVQLVITELIILGTKTKDLSVSENATSTLYSFCNWKEGQDNPVDIHQAKNKKKTDINVLLTRLDIFYNNTKETTGLAETGGGCWTGHNCAVVEDNGPAMGVTLAHEIGHLLGMTHDNQTENQCPPMLMGATGQAGEDGFKWSECSARELKQNSGRLKCMNNVPVGLESTTINKKPKNTQLPGQLYDINAQCTMFLRQDAVGCPASLFDEEPCTMLACAPGNFSENCRKRGVGHMYSFLVLDGTDCNNTRSWCQKGKCVAMTAEYSAPPVHGGWSNWDDTYSACSATCGGGIKTRKRRCDSPLPQYGGRPCVGKSVKAELCNMEKCTKDDYKQLQCMAIAPKNSGSWEPLNRYIGDDACIVRCISQRTWPNGTKHWVIIDGAGDVNNVRYYADGSKCDVLDLGVPFSRCIRGRCRNFGCDAILDSHMRYDVCGKCGGNGTTCEKVNRVYVGKLTYNKYRHLAIVSIPKGSTSIVIEQNHTAIFTELEMSNKTILSDANLKQKMMFDEEGMRILYDVNPEEIRISGPLEHNILVRTSIKPDANPEYSELFMVNYTYYRPISDTSTSEYYWGFPVPQCNRPCGGGFKEHKIECMSASRVVPEYYCDMNTKPNEEPEPCNTHPCAPRWEASGWSSCSVSCGKGIQTRTFQCLQFDHGADQVLNDTICGDNHAPNTITCDNGLCAGVWKAISESPCSKTCSRGTKTRIHMCYANATSNVPIDDRYCLPDNKPPSQVGCNDGPCFKSANCSDDFPSGCFKRYGPDICIGKYESWAGLHCKASCGVCEALDEPMCKQHVTDGSWKNFCTKNQTFAVQHCPSMCRPCRGCDNFPTLDRPCERINRMYCTMEHYSAYMMKHCRQYCCMC